MDFTQILVHLHSILRWVLLLSILAAIFYASRKSFKMKDLKSATLAMISAHLQLIIGLVLYFTSSKVVFEATSMKSAVLRFFLVEHILVMLIAIILITIGYTRAKRADDLNKARRNILIYFIISLVLILSRIPWPFMNYGGGWI